MSNIVNDIDTYQTYWQKLVAIDSDFKDIFIPPESTNKQLKEYWYKEKFNNAEHWAKSVKLRPHEYGSKVVKNAEKIIKLIKDMEKKGVL